MNRGIQFFLLFIFLVSVHSYSQTQEQLKKRRVQIQNEIKQAQSLLSESKKEAAALLSQLEDINRIISIRSDLIRTINAEADKLTQEIQKNEAEIARLEKSLDVLKKDYADMIVRSYKSRNKYSRLMFLLSSENFLQAYKRLQYMKQFTTYQKLKGEEIKATAATLGALTDSLRMKEDEKQLLIALHTRQQDSIKREKLSQEKLVTQVKAKEKKYIADIKHKQAEDRKLDAQLRRLIEAEIAKSKRGSSSKGSTGFALTPEAKKLEGDFIANKGKLPWPTEKGIVVRKYGTQKHPTMAGITIQSNGIQVATEKKAKARSIFDGKVLQVLLMPGTNQKMVLVQHGNYISAYKNLDDVNVKLGQTIHTKQDIGTIHTDAITGKTILAFSLFKETQIQNPELWIAKTL
ncbi:MAG: peptidoglycan DD-metalloendopeptidase family protein [Flavobacteriaceae bacterium]|nr:peptidoglycan DD-metalloendopeptidase family protein [Flavobacteriaceae bacterium]